MRSSRSARTLGRTRSIAADRSVMEPTVRRPFARARRTSGRLILGRVEDGLPLGRVVVAHLDAQLLAALQLTETLNHCGPLALVPEGDRVVAGVRVGAARAVGRGRGRLRQRRSVDQADVDALDARVGPPRGGVLADQELSAG